MTRRLTKERFSVREEIFDLKSNKTNADINGKNVLNVNNFFPDSFNDELCFNGAEVKILSKM